MTDTKGTHIVTHVQRYAQRAGVKPSVVPASGIHQELSGPDVLHRLFYVCSLEEIRQKSIPGQTNQIREST